MKSRLGILLCALVLASSVVRAAEEIDFDRARQLFRREQRGDTLTPDERAYLARAKAARQKQQQPSTAKGDRGGKAGALVTPGFDTAPLPERSATETYKGESGGLYGEGRNTPPAAQLDAALAAAKRVVPLDANGHPASAGKIVLLSVGMSNTTMEYRRFKDIADADPAKSPRVVVVDGAQGGQDARITADPQAAFWTHIDERLQQSGVTASQVQVVWLKQAIIGPKAEFPQEARRLQAYLADIVRIIKTRYPNTQLCYLSSRIYAGYATSQLNPEPHAFESAFSVRWLIGDQIGGAAELNHDPARGPVKAPVLLWGPYLWASGEKPRADGLVWRRGDLSEKDGTHPSAAGQQKVAQLLLTFFKNDPTARGWFLASTTQAAVAR